MNRAITAETLLSLADRAKEYQDQQERKNLVARVGDWLGDLEKAVDQWEAQRDRLASMGLPAKPLPAALALVDAAEADLSQGLGKVVETEAVKRLAGVIETGARHLQEEALKAWREFLEANPKPFIDPIGAQTLTPTMQASLQRLETMHANVSRNRDRVPESGRIADFRRALENLQVIADSLDFELPDDLKAFLVSAEGPGFRLSDVDEGLIETLSSRGLIDRFVVRRA